MINKVLFVVDNFWPNQNGGTIRIEKLIKYLPNFGWKCVVFTRKQKKMLSFELINGISIYRSNSYNLPELFLKFRNLFKYLKIKSINPVSNKIFNNSNIRLADYFFIPDVYIFWALGSIFKIRKTVKKEGINVLYSSSPSASVHVAVLIYKIMFNSSINWVIEFRDPWTLNPFKIKRLFFLEELDNYLEGCVIRSCSFVVVTSFAYRNQFIQKYPKISPNKIKYIPNGFDPEDFSSLIPPTNNSNDKINIVHAGNFYGQRSIKPFLQALYKLNCEFDYAVNKIIVNLYGVIDPEGASFNLSFPNPIFKINDTIPHKLILQELVNANWLLLVPGPGIGTMPGKVYEYLATGNPIIALVKEGPAKDLINELEIGYIKDPDDIEGILSILIDILDEKSTYKKSKFSFSKLKKFDRKNIAFEISEVLNMVCLKTEKQ